MVAEGTPDRGRGNAGGTTVALVAWAPLTGVLGCFAALLIIADARWGDQRELAATAAAAGALVLVAIVTGLLLLRRHRLPTWLLFFPFVALAIGALGQAAEIWRLSGADGFGLSQDWIRVRVDRQLGVGACVLSGLNVAATIAARLWLVSERRTWHAWRPWLGGSLLLVAVAAGYAAWFVGHVARWPLPWGLLVASAAPAIDLPRRGRGAGDRIRQAGRPYR